MGEVERAVRLGEETLAKRRVALVRDFHPAEVEKNLFVELCDLEHRLARPFRETRAEERMPPDEGRQGPP